MTRPVALVTGGNRGIGRAIVAGLLADGWTVGFTFHSGRDAAERIASASEGRARAFPFDLTDRGAADTLVRESEEALGPLRCLVNNAAVASSGLVGLTSDAEWDRLLETNLGGAFRLCRAAVRGMVSRRSGVIVNVASLSAIRGIAGQGAYAASKAGLVGLTRALAREVGGRGVRVNAVLPGFVPTGLTGEAGPAAEQALRAVGVLPGGVSAEAVAALVAFLASDRASGITGQAIVIDAGASI